MRYKVLVLCMLSGSGVPAMAQVGASIGINLPSYPHMARVSGYPVYYAADVNANLFFYDGMYWAYQDDNWYASSWYNGPWDLVSPDFVPLYVLRVPVRYYRSPPVYFRPWSWNDAPRWNEHWGNQWEQRRSGWDRWNRNASPAPAPLPTYQRQYSGDHYPRAEQQQQLHIQNYRYRPRDAMVNRRIEEQATPAPRPSGDHAPQEGNAARPNRDQATPPSHRGQDGAGGTRGHDYSQRPTPPRQAGPGNPDQRPQRQPREMQVQPPPRSQEQQRPVQREQGDRGRENPAAPAEQRRGQGRNNAPEGEGGRGQQRDRGNN